MHDIHEEGDAFTVQPKPRVPASFTLNFDDAFSDGEDLDPTFEFSPEAIRADFEKHMGSARHTHEEQDWSHSIDLDSLKIGFAVEREQDRESQKDTDPDASVSTFDIDARSQDGVSPPGAYFQRNLGTSPSSHSASRSPSIAQSMDEINLTGDFASVSLNDFPHPDAHEGEESYSNDSDIRDVLPGVHESSYPAPQIDLSQDRPLPIVAQAQTPPPNAARSQSPSTPPYSSYPLYQPQDQLEPQTVTILEATADGPQSATPTTTTSFSVPSLTIPPSESIGSPSSSHTPSSSMSTNTRGSSRHRATRSIGPSMLDKVVSKTRPTYLPPKNPTEDRKHQHDWETMMKRSRAAEEKRRKALQERRFAREQHIEESLVHWEKEIVPDWRIVHKNPTLRRLWWQGIPTKLRADMWQNAVGNPLALSKEAYKACLNRANRALSAGTFPKDILDHLEVDIARTLPSLHIFLPGTGPLYQDLKDMLLAWVVSRSDEGLGYVNGVARIAAMILLNMAPGPGFVVFRNLLERHCMRSFYGGLACKDDVEAYYRIFDTLLADGMPKIYFNFKQHQISPSSYLPDWLLSLFLDHLPFEACARLWDIILLEGDSFLFRACLAILAVLEPRLFFPDKRELLELLKGENKAALEVARRDGRPLNGGKYEIYGVDEETLWERMEAMEDWWRESTWTRLIQRELPDL